jgi:sulfur carrier protein ThiS
MNLGTRKVEKTSMPVRVEIDSSLRKYTSRYDAKEGLSLEWRPGLTVRRIVEKLGMPPDEVKIIMVNRVTVQPDHPVKEGDVIGLFPLLGGG